MSIRRFERQRAQRIKELGDITDRMSQSDKRFFERFPHRSFRFRLAHRAEIEMQCVVLSGAPEDLADEDNNYVIVKKYTSSCRLRLGYIDRKHLDTDLPDEPIRAAFMQALQSNPKVAAIDARFTSAAEAGIV